VTAAAAAVPEPEVPIVARDRPPVDQAAEREPDLVGPAVVTKLLTAIETGDDAALVDIIKDAAGLPRSAYGRAAAKPRVRIYLWICPFCDGEGRVDGDRCLDCHGFGLTDDPGDGTVERKPAPVPPAVMKRPCTDCAMRPGSPEADAPPTLTQPFFCHHGMHRVGDSYESPAYVGDLPLGAMVCRGWWDLATGQAGPQRPFRDPGGANRPEDAPEPH
jgi:hypothetical protein